MPSEIRRREANTTCSPSHTESKQNRRISKTEIETDVQEQADACQSGGGGGREMGIKKGDSTKKSKQKFLVIENKWREEEQREPATATGGWRCPRQACPCRLLLCRIHREAEEHVERFSVASRTILCDSAVYALCYFKSENPCHAYDMPGTIVNFLGKGT